jgi:hypothetical protein
MFNFGGRYQSLGDFLEAKETKRKGVENGAVPYGSPEAKAIIERVKESEKRLVKRYGRENSQK